MKRGGKEVVFIDRFEKSTQICSYCGEVTGPKGLSGLSVREWTCSYCHTHHDRDINAAQNILRKSIELSTTAGTVGKEGLYSFKTGLHRSPVVKQESSSEGDAPSKNSLT